MQALFWLLLPLAAASGWWVARYSEKTKKNRSRAMLNSAYGQGINYLLNEQVDKASEVLIRMVEVDPDTVELHLALGSLFRQRGEVNRAIAVHQNIIARSKLSRALRNQATLELGHDFLKAGLLDRAEQLFLSLLEKGVYEPAVCRHLIDLYEQEKEWEKALSIGQRLAMIDAAPWKPRLAHYHCEIGETALQKNDFDLVLQKAEQARIADPDCARATLLVGKVHQLRGDYRTAIEAYRNVEEHNPSLMPEATEEIHNCYSRLGAGAGWENYVEEIAERYGQLGYLPAEQSEQQIEKTSLQRLRYRCDECGFASRRLYWQCPGCQNWNSVKPIFGPCRVSNATSGMTH